MSWEKTAAQLKEQTEGSDKPQPFTAADVEALINKKQDLPSSPVCVVLYGHDGVCKSGICLDSRTPEEIKAGKKVVIIDLDGSAGPLKMKYYPNDDNVLIIDPFLLKDDGDIDYTSTYNKVLAITKYLRENEQKLNIATVAFDGIDTWLKSCEYVMRYETLKIDPDAQIHDRWQWAIRNRRYLIPIMSLRRMHCRKIFTTHYKELKQYVQGNLVHLEWVPDWEKSTPGIMFQKIRLTRQTVNNDVIFEAEVEKAKGALHLEGSKYVVAKVVLLKDKKDKTKFEWFGLMSLFQELEKSIEPPKQ